jgi:hypothetical protein
MKKELYLCTGTIEETPYMGSSKERQLTRIVWANTEALAIKKFTEFFESQSSDYCVSYRVHSVEASRAIE